MPVGCASAGGAVADRGQARRSRGCWIIWRMRGLPVRRSVARRIWWQQVESACRESRLTASYRGRGADQRDGRMPSGCGRPRIPGDLIIVLSGSMTAPPVVAAPGRCASVRRRRPDRCFQPRGTGRGVARPGGGDVPVPAAGDQPHSLRRLLGYQRGGDSRRFSAPAGRFARWCSSSRSETSTTTKDISTRSRFCFRAAGWTIWVADLARNRKEVRYIGASMRFLIRVPGCADRS